MPADIGVANISGTFIIEGETITAFGNLPIVMP
jgi:hypothetical protein